MYRAMWVLVGMASLGLLALNFRDYPPGNGRDEIAHLRVITFYADAHRLPILPDDLARASEEAHQPPLYYLLMAGLIELGLPHPQPDAYQPNPFVLTGNYQPEIPLYNRALYVHTWAGCKDYLTPRRENCADTSYIRTLYALRAVSVLINVVGLVFVHLTMRSIFRDDDDARWVGLLALALLTLTPSYWRTAMVINNNQLVFFFAAMSFWLLAKTLREGLRLRVSIGLGVVLGLGMLSKVLFAPMVVVTMIFYVTMGRKSGGFANPCAFGLDLTLVIYPSRLLRNHPPRVTGRVKFSPCDAGGDTEGGQKGENLRINTYPNVYGPANPPLRKAGFFLHFALIFVITFLIAGWWYARNVMLYNDPTATTISERILDSRRETRIGIVEAGAVLASWPGELWLESWTVLNTRISLWMASALGCVLTISGLVAVMRKKMLFDGGGILLMGAFVSALILAVIGAARNLHGHYSPPLMLASLPATSILMAMGGLAWIPTRLRGRTALTGILFIITGTVVFHATSFSPLFPPLERGENLSVGNRVSVRFQNGARLLGYQIEDRVLHPGDATRVRLCWEAEVPMTELYAVTTQLVLADGTKAAQQDGYPLSGRYPTTAWQPADIFCEWIPLRIRDGAPTPRAYDLRVGLYVFRGQDVPWLAGPDDWQPILLLDKLLIASAHDFSGEDEVVARVDDWGDLTRLDIAQTGNSIALDIGWRARGPSDGAYRYFVHALDADGNIVAQLDRDSGLPSNLWVDGLSINDHLRLDLPPQTTRVIFGVYDALTGRRGLWTVDGETRTTLEVMQTTR